MNRFLHIARAVACFFFGVLKSAAKDMFSPNSWREIWNFVVEMINEAKPAYGALWRKMKGEYSPRPLPFKKGVLTRPGANAYVQSMVRRMFVFLLPMFLVIYVAAFFWVLAAVVPQEISRIELLYKVLIAHSALVLVLLPLPILKYQSDNYFLGYLGERVVAEELNKLAHPQWRVFHDFQTEEGRGNIDHIVVGAKGIFCLETKTRRHSSEQRRQIALTDGAIQIKERPRDYKTVKQAKGNAAELFHFLKKELRTEDGGEVFIPFVVPVIVFPGWYVVEQKGEADVYVCTDKRIGNVLDGMPDGGKPIPEQLRKDIIAALEKHNRVNIEDML